MTHQISSDVQHGDDAKVREFESRDASFTAENLEKARLILERGQRMDWLLDAEPVASNGHKTPCFPINDVEWLFGYVDAANSRLKEAEALLRRFLDCGTRGAQPGFGRQVREDTEAWL